MSQDTRKDKRAKVVSLNVRYKSATVDEFIENHSHDVSKGGLFVKTPTPFPPGTLLKFEIRLAGDKSVISGVGRVVWKREPTQAGAEKPAGMGVKFIKIDDSSRAVIDRLVSQKAGAGSAYTSETPMEEGPHPSTLRGLVAATPVEPTEAPGPLPVNVPAPVGGSGGAKLPVPPASRPLASSPKPAPAASPAGLPAPMATKGGATLAGPRPTGMPNVAAAAPPPAAAPPAAAAAPPAAPPPAPSSRSNLGVAGKGPGATRPGGPPPPAPKAHAATMVGVAPAGGGGPPRPAPPPARKSTMIGMPAASTPPPPLEAKEGALPSPTPPPAAASPTATPPPAKTAEPMFPSMDPESGRLPVGEQTVMKQAAELLEEALKEAGGSLDEIGHNPLFTKKGELGISETAPSKPRSQSGDTLVMSSPLAEAQTASPVSAPGVMGAAAARAQSSPSAPASTPPAAAASEPRRLSDELDRGKKKGGKGGLIAALLVLGIAGGGIFAWQRGMLSGIIGGGATPVPPTATTAPVPSATPSASGGAMGAGDSGPGTDASAALATGAGTDSGIADAGAATSTDAGATLADAGKVGTATTAAPPAPAPAPRPQAPRPRPQPAPTPTATATVDTPAEPTAAPTAAPAPTPAPTPAPAPTKDPANEL